MKIVQWTAGENGKRSGNLSNVIGLWGEWQSSCRPLFQSSSHLPSWRKAATGIWREGDREWQLQIPASRTLHKTQINEHKGLICLKNVLSKSGKRYRYFSIYDFKEGQMIKTWMLWKHSPYYTPFNWKIWRFFFLIEKIWKYENSIYWQPNHMEVCCWGTRAHGLTIAASRDGLRMPIGADRSTQRSVRR